MSGDLVIWGVQWQDSTEPWGWGTMLHTTNEAEARRVYNEHLDGVRRIWGDNARELSSYRLVKIVVFESLTDEQRELATSWESNVGLGVVEVERQPRS